MRASKTKDFLQQVPGILATFQQVLEDGFFDYFSASVHANWDDSVDLEIRADGRIPDRVADHRGGVTPWLDVPAAIEQLRLQLEGRKLVVVYNNSKVETCVWSKFNRNDQPIGRFGMQVVIKCLIRTHNPRKRKRRKS